MGHWSVLIVIFFFFFFFQAEDGIRDYKVTGVQTCALPIYEGNDSAGGTGSVQVHASTLITFVCPLRRVPGRAEVRDQQSQRRHPASYPAGELDGKSEVATTGATGTNSG